MGAHQVAPAVRQHYGVAYPMRVVVSLTTIPGRERLVKRTLKSLARQTWQPDAIYLWVPTERFGSRTVPFRFRGVDVRYGADLGPAMKLLPTLSIEKDADTALITVDDDVEYPPELVDKLVRSSRLLPDQAVGFTGWSVVHDGGRSVEVRHMNEAVAGCGLFQPVQVIEGTRGVLYRRGFFDTDIFDDLRALPAFQYHDDILFSGYLANRKIGRSVRWFNSSAEQPARHWKIDCLHTGLHTTPNWWQLGWECWTYWSDQGIPPPYSCVPAAERLQLGAAHDAQPGFTGHGLNGVSDGSALMHDLSQRPWPWPDRRFREVLILDGLELRSLPMEDWLAESLRILRRGGVLKFRMPFQSPLASWIDSPAGLSVDVRRFCEAVEGRAPATRGGMLERDGLRAPVSLEREGHHIVGTVVKAAP